MLLDMVGAWGSILVVMGVSTFFRDKERSYYQEELQLMNSLSSVQSLSHV